MTGNTIARRIATLEAEISGADDRTRAEAIQRLQRLVSTLDADRPSTRAYGRSQRRSESGQALSFEEAFDNMPI